MDRGAWWATDQGVTESWTRLVTDASSMKAGLPLPTQKCPLSTSTAHTTADYSGLQPEQMDPEAGLREGTRECSREREETHPLWIALKHVYYQLWNIASPGWMHETSAQGWCTRMTQRDGMGREVREGFRMGNTCKSMADSHQCMAKTTTVL